MAEENPFSRLFTRPNNTVTLAVLQPGPPESAISISLSTEDPTTTTYDCISYDRSEDHGTVEITVDDQPMAIPKPLEAALRAFREPNDAQTLWADLLAGSSAEERSKQAAATKVTIENGSKVVAWLGAGNGRTKDAFDIVQTIANRWRQAALQVGFPENASRATQRQMQGAMQYLSEKPVGELQPGNTEAWDLIIEMFSSTYFNCVQAIPDILLAKQATIRMGDSTISWEDFVQASRAIPFVQVHQVKRECTPEQLKRFENIYSIELAERRQRTGATVELLPMIQSARDCSFSDPRECVFAMLPIATPSGRTKGRQPETLPLADYTKTVQDVFTDAAKYIVQERQDLLVWWLERPPRGKRTTGLPSWVPDWTVPLPKGTVRIMPTSDNGMRIWFDRLVPQPKRISVDNDNALHLQAHALDRVAYVSPVFTAENCRRACLTEWQRLPSLPNENLDAKVQRFFRTLILNNAGFDNGQNASLRDSAVPHRDLWISWQSVVSEEHILELLGVKTQEELQARPELLEQARANPDIATLGPQTGRSEPFVNLLRRNALGRRLFVTESGNTGMTALETLTTRQAEGLPPVPNFDEALAEPLGAAMLQNFQQYVAQRDPNAARVMSQGLAGTLPGQTAPGVRSGDLIVALVGGWQPYVVRPADAYTPAEDEGAAGTLENVSRYSFVGESYVHGIMNGEPFKTKGWFGMEKWKTDVTLVDITIV